MRAFFVILFLGCLVGCSTSQMTTGGKMLEYPERNLADWQPEKAVAEAQHDIAAGTPKVYISGTLAAYPPGISPDQWGLLKGLPTADAGIGCQIEDAELRNAQLEYARRYNEYVIQCLSKR